MAAGFAKGAAFFIALCILLSTSLSAALAQEEAPVFPLPEDAIRHFVSALTENDLQKALQACAVKEYAQGYDFVGTVDRYKTFIPIQQMAPSEYELFAQMNEYISAYFIVSQMKMMIYSFFVPEVREEKPMYIGKNFHDVEGFAQAVDPSKLNQLKLLRIDPPTPYIWKDEKNAALFQKQAELNGAQELTERIALYELDGMTYLGGFSLFRYGDGWKIQRLHSILAGTSTTGAVEEIAPEVYVSLL